MGAILGAILGALFIGVLLLVLCRIRRRRRVLVDQETQMSETWLSRPFSTAVRHGYREMPTEVPPVYRVGESPRNSKVNPSTSTSSKFPISVSALKASLGWKAKPKDVDSISSPVGPVTMLEGDPTALRAARQRGSSYNEDPFSDPYTAYAARDGYTNSSGIRRPLIDLGDNLDICDNRRSSGSGTTDSGSFTFVQPTATSGRGTTHPTTHHYEPMPSSGDGALLAPFSSENEESRNDSQLVRGNLRALMKQARGDAS